MVDQWMAPTLAQLSKNKTDYEDLYVKSKLFSSLAQAAFDKQK